MSEITELNGCGSQDSLIEQTAQTLSLTLIHLSFPAQRGGRCTPAGQQCPAILNSCKERGSIHAQQKWVRTQLKYWSDLIQTKVKCCPGYFNILKCRLGGGRITSHASRSLLKERALEGDLKNIPENVQMLYFSVFNIKEYFLYSTVSRQIK